MNDPIHFNFKTNLIGLIIFAVAGAVFLAGTLVQQNLLMQISDVVLSK